MKMAILAQDQAVFILIKYYAWFQASAAKQLRTALFWVAMQRIVVISYQCFGTTYRSHPQGSRIQKKAC